MDDSNRQCILRCSRHRSTLTSRVFMGTSETHCSRHPLRLRCLVCHVTSCRPSATSGQPRGTVKVSLLYSPRPVNKWRTCSKNNNNKKNKVIERRLFKSKQMHEELKCLEVVFVEPFFLFFFSSIIDHSTSSSLNWQLVFICFRTQQVHLQTQA